MYSKRLEMEQRLWAIMNSGRYLLQQAIDPPAYEGRLSDDQVTTTEESDQLLP